MERQRSVSLCCEPNKAALLNLGKKWICFTSNLKIEQPFQKFLCTWAVTHPPQEPGSGGKMQPKPHSHSAVTWDLQTHPTIFSLFPADTPNHLVTLPTAQRRKRTSRRPCSSKDWWHWHGSGTRSTVRLQKSWLQLPHHPHSAGECLHCGTSVEGLMGNLPFWSSKPGLVRHKRRRLDSVTVENPRLKRFLYCDVALVRRGDGLNLVCSAKLEGQGRRKHQVCFWRASPACRFSGHNWRCWPSHGVLCLRHPSSTYKSSSVLLPRYKLQA